MVSPVEWIPVGQHRVVGKGSCTEPVPCRGVPHSVPLQKGGAGDQDQYPGPGGVWRLPLPQTGGSSWGPARALPVLGAALPYSPRLMPPDRGQLQGWKTLMSLQMSIFC